eukprot:scaffold1449_cov324-Prasinococcus_capsulatus_cf.AAC.11
MDGCRRSEPVLGRGWPAPWRCGGAGQSPGPCGARGWAIGSATEPTVLGSKGHASNICSFPAGYTTVVAMRWAAASGSRGLARGRRSGSEGADRYPAIGCHWAARRRHTHARVQMRQQPRRVAVQAFDQRRRPTESGLSGTAERSTRKTVD